MNYMVYARMINKPELCPPDPPEAPQQDQPVWQTGTQLKNRTVIKKIKMNRNNYKKS